MMQGKEQEEKKFSHTKRVPGKVGQGKYQPTVCHKLQRHHWHVSQTASGRMGSCHPGG